LTVWIQSRDTSKQNEYHMTNFNLERTLAPRRPTPPWVYIAGVLITGLIIFAVVKALPGKKNAVAADSPDAEVPEPVAAVTPAPTSAPVPPPPPVSQTAKPVQPAPVPANTTPPVTQASAPTTAAIAPVGTSSSLAAARQAQASGNLLQARELALQVWNTTTDVAVKNEAESILNIVGIELVMTPQPMPEKIEYVVQSGDSLEKIAKKFGTTIELVRISNDIKGSMIRAGDRLRIFQGKFSVSVSKSNNDLVLSMNDQFFKRYRVGTGQYNKTPVGDFVINDRIAQPTWWRPDGKAIPFGDKENLLGTHWLSINVKGYGLHGTWEPETIGHQLSAGCVRMHNADIEQLFNLLPMGTPVSIRD